MEIWERKKEGTLILCFGDGMDRCTSRKSDLGFDERDTCDGDAADGELARGISLYRLDPDFCCGIEDLYQGRGDFFAGTK